MSNAEMFVISRSDGRSNSQVVIDYVTQRPPGTVITYEQLGTALGQGTVRKYGREDVQGIVTSANPRLLREHKRSMQNIRGVGYRIAEAKDHVELSLVRRRRADIQMKAGRELLRNVHWEELDPMQRKIHEGHLMITEALWRNQLELLGRQKKTDVLIESLTQRVEALEE